MGKLWLIAKREYLFNIKRPAFLFAAFGTPIFFVGVMILSIALTENTERTVSDLSVGYVDNAAVLDEPNALEDYTGIFAPYESEESARAALDDGTIDTYFVVAENYAQSARVEIYSYETMPDTLDNVVRDLLRVNIARDLTLRVPEARLLDSSELTIRLEDSGREVTEDGIVGLLLFPVVFAVVFILATQITSGFLMSGLVEEKTNRVIELLVTSATPMQLLGGKILGLGLLGLTQLAVWVGLIVLAMLLGQDLPVLSGITLPVDLLVFGLIYFVLGYFMVAALMAAIGVLVGSEQESRQVAGFISLPLFTPYLFLFSFLVDSNGTIPVILSMIPFTSPMAMIMRLGIGGVPLVEVALSMSILLAATVFFVWASVKIFRWGVLLYGKKLNIREIVRVLRGRVEPGIAHGANGPQVKEVAS